MQSVVMTGMPAANLDTTLHISHTYDDFNGQHITPVKKFGFQPSTHAFYIQRIFSFYSSSSFLSSLMFEDLSRQSDSCKKHEVLVHGDW